MFINEDIVAVIFRLINFISVIGLGIYFFKKNVAPDMWYLITKKKEARESLFNRQAMLEKKQSDLDTLLKEESLLCDQFRIKIDTWKQAVEQESVLHQKKQLEYKTIIAQRAAQRALHKENSRIQIIVMDSLIPELQESLSHYFNKEQPSVEYLNSIVHFMDKKI